MTLPDWKPDPLSDRLSSIDVRLTRLEARFDGLEARMALLERMMVWGFAVNGGLTLAVLAGVLLK